MNEAPIASKSIWESGAAGGGREPWRVLAMQVEAIWVGSGAYQGALRCIRLVLPLPMAPHPPFR